MSEAIALQISDRTFVTTKSTLIHGMRDGSQYFKTTFDFNNRSSNQSISGDNPVTPTYYLDLDPEIFGHVLSYLRSGVMPLLWEKKNGFDYGAYAKLQRMAEFLQIKRLTKWLKDKEYVKAVQHKLEISFHSAQRDEKLLIEGGYAKLDWEVKSDDQRTKGRIVVTKKWVDVDSKILFDERQI